MPTVKDVARLAGVSIGTVDRVLHRRGRFSEDTAQKVLSAMKELGYTPNIMARNLSRSQNCNIAVLMPSPEQDSGYWELPLQGMHQAVDRLKVYKVSITPFFYNRYDPVSCEAAWNNSLKQQFDGYLIAPLLSTVMEKYLKVLPLQIPRIFFDTDLPSIKRISYIGQNSYKSGQLAAKLMQMLIAVNPAIVNEKQQSYTAIIRPNTDNEHLTNRILGYKNATNQPAKEFVLDHSSENIPGQCSRILSEICTTGGCGVYIVDASAHFIAQWFTTHPEIQRLPIIGFDLLQKNRKALQNGSLDVILTQHPEKQGYEGVMSLYRNILLGEKKQEDLYMPIDIIMMENLAFLPENRKE